jgi:hypothetical protein
MRARGLIAGVALLVAVGTAAFASADARRVVGDCFKSQVRPATIIVACADDNLVLIHVHWSTFGGPSARATGTYYVNDCKPYCAAGTFHAYPIKLVLSRAKPCPDGHDDYRLVSVTFAATRPPGLKASGALGLLCPLKG